MGLLDTMGAPQAPGQAAPMGGLLGAAPSQGGGDQSVEGLQMAQTLLANPTAQVAQQIVVTMKAKGMENAEVFEQLLAQTGDNPEALKQMAQQAMQFFQQGAAQ